MKAKFEKFKDVFKWGDLIVVLVLVVAAALSFYLAFKPSNAATVEIYSDGVLLYSVPLDEDREIVIDNIGHNVVKIENGKVFMEESDCAGQDCVHMQPVSKEGGIIVCLPNKIVVKIVSGDVDAVT